MALVLWLLQPTPLLSLRARASAKALWEPGRRSDLCDPAGWRAFELLAKLSKRGKSSAARAVLEDVYRRMPPHLRVDDPDALEALLSNMANVLRAMPKDAVLVVTGEVEAYPIRYLQTVDGVRRDVIAVEKRLWGCEGYRRHIWRSTPLRFIIGKKELQELDFASFLRRLATCRPIFVLGDTLGEIPADSLYRLPAMCAKYSPKPIPPPELAKTAFEMLCAQNWNYVAENPPLRKREHYTNTLSNRLAPELVCAANLIHSTGQDSLLRRLLRRFDPWMSWDPLYLVMRAGLAERIGEDPHEWTFMTEQWLSWHPGHWLADEVRRRLRHVTQRPKG